MPNIMNVDYEAIPAIARQVRIHAQDLNTQMLEIYSNISEMHNSWYGIRYNTLVKDFNNIMPEINNLLDLVVTEIPYTLETIANNYALVDRGSKVTSAEKTTSRKLSTLVMPNDIGMKFLTNEVTSTKTKVSTNFKNAKEIMNSIENIYNRIQWQSEASEAFRSRFTKLKNNIVNAFDNLEVQFIKLMTQTVEDIQATENANTVQ